MKNLRTISILLLLSSIAPMVQAQSLAQIARQERERQKGQATTVLVINGSTTATLNPGNTAVTSATTGATTDAAKPAAPTGPTDSKGRDEKYWRGVFDKARTDLKRAEDRMKLIDLKMNDLSSQLLRESVYVNELTLRSEIDKTKSQQVIAQKDLADSQQRIKDLEEELRRSGGLPGWAR